VVPSLNFLLIPFFFASLVKLLLKCELIHTLVMPLSYSNDIVELIMSLRLLHICALMLEISVSSILRHSQVIHIFVHMISSSLLANANYVVCALKSQVS
jgi:hypothetical protein